jgi:hypothetical protein
MGLMLNERCNADEIAKKMTFRDACAAHERWPSDRSCATPG